MFLIHILQTKGAPEDGEGLESNCLLPPSAPFHQLPPAEPALRAQIKVETPF